MTRNRIFVTALLLLFPFASNGRDISLAECLELSRTNNPDVANAVLDSKISVARRQETLSLWFPQVSAGMLGFHALNPLVNIGLKDVLGSSDAVNNLNYFLRGSDRIKLLDYGYFSGVSVAQPVFAGGRIAHGNALAVLGVEAAGVKRDMALRDNEDNISAKYWLAVSLGEKKKALQQGIELVRSLEKDVASAVGAGLARESDLMQVRLKMKELESTMIKLRSSEKLAKMDLFNAAGLEYRVLELDSLVLCDGFDSLLPPEEYRRDEQAVAASLEESRLLDMNVEAKALEKKLAVGEGLPEIGIGASYGYGRMVGNPTMNGAVYATVKIPLSDWGKTARKIQRCQFELEKAQNERDYLSAQLLLKVNKEWIDLSCAWDRLESAREAESISALIESQKREEYDAGLCTLTELLQIQSEHQTVMSGKVDCAVEYCNALAAWEK